MDKCYFTSEYDNKFKFVHINDVQEKEKYFKEQIKTDGAYFNVKYTSGETEFIWVKEYTNWTENGESWFLEYPTNLISYVLDNDSLTPYYDEEDDITYIPFDSCYIKDNKAYEIDSWQTSPFLPKEFKIYFVTDVEEEAVKYMMELKNNSN